MAKKGLNTIFNLDAELNDADKMFDSFFNKEAIVKRKSKKREELIVKYDEVFQQVEDKKKVIYALETVDRVSLGKESKLISEVKAKTQKDLKSLQSELKDLRKNMVNIEKFTDSITIETNFGNIRTTYSEIYENAGSVADFIKKKLMSKMKSKIKDIKKEIDVEAEELKGIGKRSLRANEIKKYAKRAKQSIPQIEAVIEKIKNNSSYPIMYEFNESKGEMKLHIVGWEGAAELKKNKRSKKTKVYNEGERFDFEDNLIKIFKK